METCYTFKSYSFDKDPTGCVFCTLIIEDTNNTPYRVEVPYDDVYKTLPPGTIIKAVVTDNNISLQIPNGEDLAFGIGKAIPCPWCNQTLINKTESDTSKRYCFNIGCGQNPFSTIMNTCLNLNLGFTEEELARLNTLVTFELKRDVHLLSVYTQLTSIQLPSDIERSIIKKILNFVKTCTPYRFFKMLSFPNDHDDYIRMFDTAFGSVEDCYNAMLNYRDLYPSLPQYDSAVMGLIFIVISVNHSLIQNFLSLRRNIKAFGL